jgi:molecular chaperone GrpE (heat shock protein)
MSLITTTTLHRIGNNAAMSAWTAMMPGRLLSRPLWGFRKFSGNATDGNNEKSQSLPEKTTDEKSTTTLKFQQKKSDLEKILLLVLAEAENSRKRFEKQNKEIVRTRKSEFISRLLETREQLNNIVKNFNHHLHAHGDKEEEKEGRAGYRDVDNKSTLERVSQIMKGIEMTNEDLKEITEINK